MCSLQPNFPCCNCVLGYKFCWTWILRALLQELLNQQNKSDRAWHAAEVAKQKSKMLRKQRERDWCQVHHCRKVPVSAIKSQLRSELRLQRIQNKVAGTYSLWSYLCKKGGQMTHPALTRAFLQAVAMATMHCQPEGVHSPTSPCTIFFLLVQNLSSKRIASSDNMRAKTDDSKRRHWLLKGSLICAHRLCWKVQKLY